MSYRLSPLVASLALLTLTACADRSAPEPLLAPRSGNVRADVSTSSATTSTVSYDVPWARTVRVPCANGGAGEYVALSGTLHNVLSQTTSPTGVTQLLFHHQLDDASGVGLTTGDVYRAMRVGQESAVLGIGTAVDVGETLTVVGDFSVIGEGTAVNFQIRTLFHATVNPDGTVTTVLDDVTVTCG